jgi:phosphatidylglycerol lysyltransferase
MDLLKGFKGKGLNIKKVAPGLSQSMTTSQEALQTAVKTLQTGSKTAAFRIDKLKQYGRGSLAYSSLQAGMQYYMNDKLGYCAYVPMSDSEDSVCVLADPICSKENLRAFLDAFLLEKKDPIFLHASRDTAEILNERGFSVNELGVETIIEIQKFTLSGNKRQALRQARNNAKRDNLVCLEVLSSDPEMRKAFRKISEDWMKHKVMNDSEMQFIVRPIVYVDEIDVRKFVALKGDTVVGFIIFDPIYENGKVKGYIANHLRSNLDRSYSVVDFILLEALDIFKAEGKEELSLGLSPLAKVDDSEEFRHSKLLTAHFKYSFEKANFLYNFKNLYRHKSKYRPELPGAHEEKVYCCMKTRFLLVRIYDVYSVLGFHPIKQIISHFGKAMTTSIRNITAGKDESDLTKPESTEKHY